MKILKFGNVTMRGDDLYVSGFTFDGEGESYNLNEMNIAAMKAIIAFLAAELSLMPPSIDYANMEACCFKPNAVDDIAPPVAAGSVDTEEFAELMQNVRHGLYAQSWPPLITYINAWGAQQREQGEYAAQSAAEDRICNLIAVLGDEKLRAEKAEARAITAEDRLAAANNMLTGVNAELKNAEARSAELQEALDVAMLVVSLHAQ